MSDTEADRHNLDSNDANVPIGSVLSTCAIYLGEEIDIWIEANTDTMYKQNREPIL